MLTSLRRFFVPPVFLEDDKTRTARVLSAILNTFIGILPLIFLGGLLGGNFPPRIFVIVAILFAIMIVLRFMLSVGQVKPAGAVLIITVFIGTALALFTIGTIRAPVIIFLILINVIAGLVLGRRAAIWAAIINTIFVFGFVQAEIAGVLPAPTFATTIAQAATFAACSLLTAVLLNLSLKSVEESLKRAQTNEREIRELAATLEQRVEERSHTLSEVLRIARLGNWEYDTLKDEFTFNDDFYDVMRTTAEREGGYKMASMQYIQRFVYPEDIPMVGLAFQQAAESTDPNYRGQIEHRVLLGDGEIGYVTVRFRIEKDAEGRNVKSVGANQDVTEQKLIEQILQTNKAQLSEALRIARLGNWEYDFLKDEFTFNDDFYALMRTTAAQEGGYKMSAAHYTERFVYPEDAALVGVEIGKSVATTDPNFSSQLDHRVIFGDGEMGYVTVRLRIKKDLQGRTVLSYGANQDITERKKAESILSTNEARLSETLRIAQMGNWEYDVLKDEFIFNDQFYALLRTTAEREGGYTMSSMQYVQRFVYPEDIPTVGLSMQQGLQPNNPAPQSQLEHRVIYGDGEIGHVLVRLNVESDAEGNPLRSVGANQDITARKKIEEILAKRATELETVTQMATAIGSIQNPQEMLQYVCNLTKERFNFYHAHVYLVDEEDGLLELVAGAGEAGQMMVAGGHAIPLAREQSLVARAARTRQGVVVNNVTQAPDFLPNPLLPETRSELAVPLLVRDQVLGVLDVQSDQLNAFTEEDVRIQIILAAQIAVALENARANEQTTKALADFDKLMRRLTHEGWESYLVETGRAQIGYVFEGNQLTPLQENGQVKPDGDKTFTQPVMLRGENIGQLATSEAEVDEEELQLVLAAVSQGLSAHLENLRLTQEAERRVDELRIINEIGQVLTSEVELLPIVIAVVNTLNEAFKANILYIALYDEKQQIIEIPYMIDHDNPTLDEPPFPFGVGINSVIIKTRRRIFINENTERQLLELGALPTVTHNAMAKSFIGIPLIAGENVIGVLSIQDVEREGRFTQDNVDLLTTISSNVAVALQNARLFAETQKRATREVKANLIGQKIQNATTVEGALQTAIRELGVALKARRTVVQLSTQPMIDEHK